MADAHSGRAARWLVVVLASSLALLAHRLAAAELELRELRSARALGEDERTTAQHPPSASTRDESRHYCRLLPSLLGLTPSMLREIASDLALIGVDVEQLPEISLQRNQPWARVFRKSLPVRMRKAGRPPPSNTERLSKAGFGLAFLSAAFVRLHNFAMQQQLAPLFVSGYGEGRGLAGREGNANSFDTAVVARLGFKVFFQHGARRFGLRHHAQCLAWDVPKQLLPMADGRCAFIDVFNYREAAPSGHGLVAEEKVLHGPERKALGGARAQVHGDLVRMADAARLPRSLLAKYDLIVANEVFEHVHQPFEAAKALYTLLAPGGLVFWSAPFIARNHGVPSDFFRYTDMGARQIFVDAGFTIEAMNRVGDSTLASGYLLSFGTGDFDRRHLWHNLLHNISNETARDPSYWLYASIVLVARKPHQGAST